MLSTNLIYNGDFSKGTTCWSGTDLTVENGILTVQGSLIHSEPIPVANGRTYRLSFDMKVNDKGTSTSRFNICMRPFDNTKSAIPIRRTNKVANTITTLAADLTNGDTTATVTSSANWRTNVSHQAIGICDKLAWGTNRSTMESVYTAIDGNVLTLSSAWNQGTVSAGTTVQNFISGSAYYYPIGITNANLPTDWTSYSTEFTGGDNIRYSCQYVKFSTYGYTYNCSFRNIRLECISDLQFCDDLDDYNTNLSKQGIFTGKFLRESDRKIRYIRDTISGNTKNTNNHWCGFQVYNDVGEDIAWGRDVEVKGTTYSNNVVTDGNLTSSYIQGGSGTVSLLFDIGYLENISKIKIWHYYPDGRTYYDNVTEVSVDGENWYTVYSGEKPETSTGNEIILSPDKVSIYKNGTITAHEFYEI